MCYLKSEMPVREGRGGEFQAAEQAVQMPGDDREIGQQEELKKALPQLQVRFGREVTLDYKKNKRKRKKALGFKPSALKSMKEHLRVIDILIILIGIVSWIYTYICIYMLKLMKVYILIIYSLLYVNYTSIKIFGKQQQQQKA